MPFSQWPAPARAIAVAVQDAVTAARNGDRPGFEDAIAETAALDEARVAVVLGAVVQMLLEETQPDGLGADDVRALLEACVRSAVPWYPAIDVDLMLVVVGGALGMQEPGTEPASAGPATLTAHAVLLVVELLRITRRPLEVYLDAAIAEIARDQTMEMP